MARMINWLPRVARRHREKGVAILLTLGVLSLTLVLVLSFAMTSTIDRKAAMNYANQVRARMLAESGLARAIGFLREEMGDDLNSFDHFYRAAAGGTWEGRAVTGSVNLDGSSRVGIDDAFAVKFTGYDESLKSFLPTPTSDATLGGSLGWLLIESVQDTSPNGDFSLSQTKVIGRLTYLIEDVSGYIDPTAWVDPGYMEGLEFMPPAGHNPPTTRTASGNGIGFSVTDLNIRFALDPVTSAGHMLGMNIRNHFVGSAVHRKWHSYKHILSIPIANDNSDVIFENLRPFSVPETSRQWWNDTNNNNTIDTGELRDKLDLTNPVTVDENNNPVATGAVAIYNEMVGANLQAGGTYSDQTKFSPWLRSLTNLPGGSYDAAALRHIAARTALNIQDYNDLDNDPRSYFIDAATFELKPWVVTETAAYESLVHGAEAGWHIGAGLLELHFWRHPAAGFTKIEIKPHFNMEVFHAVGLAPTAFKDAGYKLAVTYEYQVTAGDNSVTLSYGGTHTFSETDVKEGFTLSWASSGGECVKAANPQYLGTGHDSVSGNFAFGAWSSMSATDPIIIDYLRLNRVILWKEATGELIDVVPEFASSSIIMDYPGSTTVTMPPPPAAGGLRSYAGLYFRAQDPLCMKLYDLHPLESLFLDMETPKREISPPHLSIDDQYLGDGLPSADPPGWNQSDQPFGAVEFSNGFNDSQVYEIGRVKGYLPGRSLRLWSFSDNDASTHDGRLLDLFYAPNMPSIAGKVNINTENDNVLLALFTDIAANPTTAVNNAKIFRGSNGFQSIGQLGGVHDLINRVPTEDKSAETDYLPRIANLATVEQNFYNIIVTAQSIRDTTGIPAPDSINLGMAPTIGARTGEILAEQQIMATVYHNVFTDELEILRYEYLYD
jgi:hypothetical protein